MMTRRDTWLFRFMVMLPVLIAVGVVYAGVYTSGMTVFSGGTVPNATTFNSTVTFAGGIAASGSAANDFSGSTGTFKTSTGNVTIGGSITSGLKFVNNTTGLLSSSGNGAVYTDDVDGSTLLYGSTKLRTGLTLIVANVNNVDSSTAIDYNIASGTPKLTAGSTMVAIQNGGGAGILRLGLVSGPQQVFSYGEDIGCSGGNPAAGLVVVWNGTRQVAAAAASTNLTTIAGVSVTACSSNVTTVARMGRVMVGADAGISAGNLVGTSGTNAGNVAASSPGAGAIVGRAVENTGQTTAGKVIIDLILG